jgi:pyridoxine kinase
MAEILSIQSHVCYGYVGNRAAVFPLQRLRHNVTAVNTVQFSNHTGYGDWQGDIMTHKHIQNVLAGLEKRGVFNQVDAVLSGYLGDAALGETIMDTVKRIRKNHRILYSCDPVIGDMGRGIFVKPEVALLFKEQCIHIADIITPNLYELNFLAGADVYTMAELEEACDYLHAKGPKTILVTSVELDNTPKDHIQMYLSHEGSQYLIDTPKLNINPAPNGCGDVTAAIFLARMLEGLGAQEALLKTAASIYAVFEATFKAKSRELQLIQAQDEIEYPSFEVRLIDLSNQEI